MRVHKITAFTSRAVLGLAVPAALALAGSGPVLASAAAPATGGAASACTVSWVGPNADGELWTNPKNWSTGQVPGPASDVCITSSGDDVNVDASINVHSLLVGPDAGIAFLGTSASPVTAQVTGTLTLITGGSDRMGLTDTTLDAAQISDPGSIIFTAGTSTINSPSLTLGPSASLQALTGTTTLTHLAQFSGGTLTGVHILTGENVVVVLPGDVTHLVSANLTVSQGAEMTDPAGHNALAKLATIDAASTLTDESSLRMTGSLTAFGTVNFGSQPVSLVGNYTQAGGALGLGATNFSAGQVKIGHGASLTADAATIAGNLVNDGTVMSESYVAPGPVNVTGNYTQARGAQLIPAVGTTLAVAGAAALAGEVAVFQPLDNPATSTTVITFRTLTGNFTSHNLGVRLVDQPNQIEALLIPQISVTPRTAAPGQQVTVNGGSFGFDSISIYLDHVGGTPLATTNGGIKGTFTVPVTIPSATTAGPHKLIAVAPGGAEASTGIVVS